MSSTKAKLKGGKMAGKAAWKLGKAEAKLIRAAMSGREPRSSRYLKYGLFLAAGLAIGAAIRSAKKPPPPHDKPHHKPHDKPDKPHHEPHRPPHEEPRVGTHGGGLVSKTVVPEEQDTLEQRIRTKIGEDERTKNMPRPNVTVVDGVAELRGPAPDEATKAAAAEVAASVEGVREVKNLIAVV